MMEAVETLRGNNPARHPVRPSLRITDAARTTGTTPRALRYYEEIGLLSPARPVGHVRVYDAADVGAIHDIVTLRRLGFDMAEITAFVHCRSGDSPRRSELIRKLENRLHAIVGQQTFLRSAISRLSGRSASNDD